MMHHMVSMQINNGFINCGEKGRVKCLIKDHFILLVEQLNSPNIKIYSQIVHNFLLGSKIFNWKFPDLKKTKKINLADSWLKRLLY